MSTIIYSLSGIALIISSAFIFTYMEQFYRKNRYGLVRLMRNITKNLLRAR